MASSDRRKTMRLNETPRGGETRRKTNMKANEGPHSGETRRRTVRIEDHPLPSRERKKTQGEGRKTVRIDDGGLDVVAEIEEAMKDVHESIGDENALLFYDKKVSQDSAKLVELESMSRKTMFRRQTKIAKKKSLALPPSLLPILKEEVETPEIIPQAAKVTSDETLEIKLDPWSKEGLIDSYDKGVNVGKGLSIPPHIIPYRFLGTPDLKRDDSLLPKTFQFAKRMKFPGLDDHRDAIQCVEGEPMVLPLTLRAACWNGERWEGTSQTASEAKRMNGFDALYSEVVKSQKRVILCKTGQYFLEGVFAPSVEEKENFPGERKSSIVSELPERQHKRRASVAKPFIPPLPLGKLPPFEQKEELGHNQEILTAYRDESSRYATARRALPSNRSPQDNQVLTSGRTVSGLPLKACGDTSLRQLGDILSTNTRFRTMQNHFNGKLLDSLRAIQTTRPYHYAREYGMKHKGLRDPHGTPGRAATFRKYLAKFKWYEDLIEMAYKNGCYPTKTEIVIIEDIRRVLDQGEDYTLDTFTDLIFRLGQKRMDTNSPRIQDALLLIQDSLNITDLDLLSSLILSRAKIPDWLECKKDIVKQAIRNLSPERFPMCKWADKDGKPRPKTPIAKLRKLFWMTEKLSSLSHNSLLGTHKQSILGRDIRSHDSLKSFSRNLLSRSSMKSSTKPASSPLSDHGSIHKYFQKKTPLSF